MRRRWWLILLTLCLVPFLAMAGLLVGRWVVLGLTPELVNPLSNLSYIQIRESIFSNNRPRRVMGFLPYWTMADATAAAELTDIAYFSVTLNRAGNLVESVDGERDMGLYRLQGELFEEWVERAQRNQQRMHITVTAFNNDDISGLLSNEKARQQASFTISQLVASYPFDGVVIDIEYTGPVTDRLREQYVDLLRTLDTELAQIDPNIELSAAVFGSAASKYQIWDMAAMEPYLDTVVVMSYDYHVRSSATVGPVAPIFGKGTGRWQDDVVSNMRDMLLAVPARKILLGIPFYGYEWTATSDQLGATTFPKSGTTATYKRVIELLQDAEVAAQERWDDDALSPYVIYEEGGQTQFIYYENSRSFSYKLDFVNQVDLGGIAIWALGYEGAQPELWKVIDTKFTN